MGMLTPARAWFGPDRFVVQASAVVEAVRSDRLAGTKGGELYGRLAALDVPRMEAVSPVERLRHALHGWVAFGIMPIFAFANAGVTLGHINFAGGGGRVFVGALLGLVIGKPAGLIGFSWLAVRLGLAARPPGVSWTGITVVGLVAGIGFTMALFIATLALPPGALMEVGKVGILTASAVAALIGSATGRLLLPAPKVDGRTIPVDEQKRPRDPSEPESLETSA